MSDSRHSYHSVARFFPVMKAILEAKDSQVSTIDVDPKQLQLVASTCAARLRDAIQAVKHNQIITPMDHLALVEELRHWVITQDSEMVRAIHLTRRRKQIDEALDQKLKVELKSVFVERELIIEEVYALCLLLGKRVISGEYRIKLPTPWKLLPSALEGLKASYDIAIIDNKDGTHTIV